MNKIAAFKEFIWNFYHQNKREFAWRHVDNPYYVVVSELMLQQTQTHRVIHKYEEFIAAFPTFESLAASSLRDVLFGVAGPWLLPACALLASVGTDCC